jgi:hypothetical protein
MSRRAIPFLVAVLASVAFASSAQAAVSFSFTETAHEQPSYNRGDEYASYLVKLKNSGDTATTGITTVAIDLPAGTKFYFGEGSGWSCDAEAQSCSSSRTVAASAEFPSLQMRAWLYPEAAPDIVTAEFTVSGGGALTSAEAEDSFSFGPRKPFQVEGFTARAVDPLDSDYAVAGGHPFAATSTLEVSTRRTPSVTHAAPLGELNPVENLRDLYFELPAGFVANPETVETCTLVRVQQAKCPDAAVIGGLHVEFAGSAEGPAPLYRIEPEAGYPAAFAFRPVAISGLTVVLRAKLRSNGDYGVTSISPLPPQAPEFMTLRFATLCGYGPILQPQNLANPIFLGCKKPGDPGAREIPALSNPTRCAGEPPVTRVYVDSFQNAAAKNAEGLPDLADPNWKSAAAVSPQNEGCAALSEAWTGVAEPTFSLQPATHAAGAPAPYTAHLHIPQDGLLEANGLATAHLKDTTVTLPEGIALNPAAADGLGACSLEQAGYLGGGFGSPNPMRFSTVSAGCPESAKVGMAEVRTPILAEPLLGAVYLAAQDANPFGSKFAIYLVIDDRVTGIKATLPGRVSPDPASGRITTVFANNPQAPIEDVEIDFFGGPRASLANPDVCGTYTTNTAVTPWSAADPEHPTAAETADPADAIVIDSPAVGRSSCPTTKAQRPFTPGFEAGGTNPLAGAHTPFTLRITRPEGDQELSGLSVTLPPGLVATIKGTQLCPEGAIAAAMAPGRSGKSELAAPSCPPQSQIATTTIGAGAGPTPYYVKTGKAYLTGPYKGAPLSMSFIVPAVAGPFDLGVQVVRAALRVDPRTAQVTAVSDPIPQILEGVPLNIRDIRVEVDRPGFTLNPTNCEAMAIGGLASGGSGAQAALANRFQLGGCEGLGFKPDLKLQLSGSTKRAAYQRLTATVTTRPGDANFARAAVTLPHSAFLAQEHIRTICTRVQFVAHTCPKGSVYGHAEATTPLLEGKLAGPVYLRSSDNKLPDLVAGLRGPDATPIEVELAGRTDSVHGGIRNTFDIVPDAPVTKFTLRLFGGKKSLIVNSRDLCKGTQRATVRFTAQNGRTRNFRPVVGNACRKGGKSKAGRR